MLGASGRHVVQMYPDVSVNERLMR